MYVYVYVETYSGLRLLYLSKAVYFQVFVARLKNWRNFERRFLQRLILRWVPDQRYALRV